jgi:aminopeptidase N
MQIKFHMKSTDPALTLLLFLLTSVVLRGQGLLEPKDEFTRQDTLRGSITVEREWWDLLHYDLSVTVNPDQRTISGQNTITFKVLKPYSVMQIDLQEPLELTSAKIGVTGAGFTREGNVYFITLPPLPVNSTQKLTVTYQGKPRIAKNAPWDGGFSWSTDENGNHFVATSNQGLGASVWWPCKDHMYDEPDSGMVMRFTVPEDLTAVGNGRLIAEKKAGKDQRTFVWEVRNPINNYGVNVNIGDYISWTDTYDGELGELDLVFYVLRDHEEQARQQFKDAYRTLEALEHWFGPYPFYEDSYKLVEVPYLGMEHQSSVTYGNRFKKGYMGRDLSMTGEGLMWDFIIIHESGHEWFANNITYRDAADMWIHEGFTSYSESLFIEYFYGKERAATYTRGLRSNIANQSPVIGPYGVNKEGSGDMYYKGHNMLHMIRQIIDDDEKWRSILRGLNKDFYHQTVTSRQIEEYIIEKSGIDLQTVFDQYLRDIRIPSLEYRIQDGRLSYRWNNVVPGFEMPVKVRINDEEKWLEASEDYQIYEGKNVENLEVDPNFYVSTLNVLGN